MNKLWEWINKTEFTREGKIRSFLFLNSMICSILGFFVWLVVSRFTLNTIDWAICFVGYAGFFIGYLGGFFFLCRQ